MVKNNERKPIFIYLALLFEKEFPGKEYAIIIRFSEYYFGVNIHNSTSVTITSC